MEKYTNPKKAVATVSFFAATVITATVALSAAPAAAHYLSSDSVDCSSSPCEIRYENYSRYGDFHGNAIYQWEALPGGVNIAYDDPYVYVDLELRDYSSNDGRCGY